MTRTLDTNSYGHWRPDDEPEIPDTPNSPLSVSDPPAKMSWAEGVKNASLHSPIGLPTVRNDARVFFETMPSNNLSEAQLDAVTGLVQQVFELYDNRVTRRIMELPKSIRLGVVCAAVGQIVSSRMTFNTTNSAFLLAMDIDYETLYTDFVEATGLVTSPDISFYLSASGDTITVEFPDHTITENTLESLGDGQIVLHVVDCDREASVKTTLTLNTTGTSMFSDVYGCLDALEEHLW